MWVEPARFYIVEALDLGEDHAVSRQQPVQLAGRVDPATS